jgi:prepilin-type N-terminal cleavage/methylation domain-containing protein
MEVLWNNATLVTALGIAAVCSLAFMLLRTLALATCLNLVHPGHGISRWSVGKLFCAGVAIEAISWPGKLWADAFRIQRLRGAGHAISWAQAATTLALWRITSILGTVAMLMIVTLQLTSGSWTVLLQAGVLLIVIAAGLLVRIHTHAQSARSVGTIAGACLMAMLASLCDLACLVVIASALTSLTPWQAATAHAIAMPAGSLSPLPLGLGAYEAAFIAASGLTVSGGLPMLLAYRLLGPGLTLVIGAACLAINLPKLAHKVPTTAQSLWHVRPRRPALRLAGSRGFTLVELIAVIVVLAILAAVAAPRFFNYGNRATDSLAKSIYAQLQSARTGYLAAWGKLPDHIGDFIAADGRFRPNKVRPDGMLADLGYTFYVNPALRGQLADPQNEVVIAVPSDPLSSQMRLNFKNGAVATYVLDSQTSSITFTYTAP